MRGGISCWSYHSKVLVTANIHGDVFLWKLPDLTRVHIFSGKTVPTFITPLMLGQHVFFLSAWSKDYFDLLYCSDSMLRDPSKKLFWDEQDLMWIPHSQPLSVKHANWVSAHQSLSGQNLLVNIGNQSLAIYRINTCGPTKSSLASSHSFLSLHNSRPVRATIYAEVAPEKFLIYSATHDTFALLNTGSPTNEIIAISLCGLRANSIRAILFPAHKASHFFYTSENTVNSLPLKLEFNKR